MQVGKHSLVLICLCFYDRGRGEREVEGRDGGRDGGKERGEERASWLMFFFRLVFMSHSTKYLH